MTYFIILIVSLFTMPAIASSQELDYFGASFENDIFFDDDGGYSNGLMVNWGYYDLDALDNDSLPNWLAYLTDKTYLSSLPNRQYATHYNLGQFIQTPVDIKQTALIEEDAPYVGLLAWEVNILVYNQSIIDDLSLTIGVVGPAAGAKELQKSVHEQLSANQPMGWDNQIDNEVVVRLQLKRLWRNASVDFGSSEVDFISGLSVGVGNLLSDASAGIGIRWGQQLQSSFASSTPFPIQQLKGQTPNAAGWYIFANLSGSYVLNDIFIDGNTFNSSHHVDLIHWQTAATVGVVFNIYHWNLMYSLTYSSDQYKDQSEDSRFGTLSAAYHF